MFQLFFENHIFQFIVVVFIGLVLGSFCTAIIYREENGYSWVWNKNGANKARSFCPSCFHVLNIRDLVPLFSWFVQRGRCRYCKNQIPILYVFVECFVLCLCLVTWLCFGFSLLGFALMFVSPFAFAQVVLIFKCRKISFLLCGVCLMVMLCLFCLHY